MSHRAWLSVVTTAIAASAFLGFFQNCTRSDFTTEHRKLGLGGGEIYDGKIFVAPSPNLVCDDGVAELGRIIRTLTHQYFLLRYDCANLESPTEIPGTEIAVANETSLIYKGLSFIFLEASAQTLSSTVATEAIPDLNSDCPLGSVLDAGMCYFTIVSTRKVFHYSTCTAPELKCRSRRDGTPGTSPWGASALQYGMGDAAKGWESYALNLDFVRISAAESPTGCSEYHFTAQGEFNCPQGTTLKTESISTQSIQAPLCSLGDPGVEDWIVTRQCAMKAR